MDVVIRKCCSCQEWKPADHFYKNKSCSGGIGYECKVCDAERRKRNVEKRRPYMRDYRRKHYLVVQGKNLRIVKRPYPSDDCCELCGRQVRRLEYHHWDDSHPELGMWICWYCHHGAEWFERGLELIYEELKKRITGT